MNLTSLRTKLILSILLVALIGIVTRTFQATDTLVDGSLAVETLKPSDSAYLAQKAKPNVADGIVVPIAWVVGVISLITLWVPRRKVTSVATTAAVAFLAMGTTGCLKPPLVDKFVEVGPNETVFVIPLQGDNKASQGKFDSAEYLNTKKVAAKRIQIPMTEKKVGRFAYEIEWIDAVRVIKVNRSMVSREWSPPSNAGEKDSSIPVVTRDSIQLGVGCAVTAFIEEEDAAEYLYYHGETPLAEVMDNNVRNWCVSELTKAYGQMDLQQAQTNFPAIFQKVFSDAKSFFKTKGISILQFGNAEGYEFKKPEIQKALNATFIAEQDNKTAAQEKLAQDERNKKLLASAQTERLAAEELFKAREAATMKNSLEIQQMEAKAKLEMAQKWNGQLPANILPSNSPLLMNMGANHTPSPAPVK